MSGLGAKVVYNSRKEWADGLNRGKGDMKDLRDRVALVTGASRGIGRATALALARAGAHLALVARRSGPLEEVAAEVRALERQALALPADVRVEEQSRQAVRRALAHFGRLDVLVANAGVYYRSPIRSLSVDILRQSLAVNFYGSVYFVLEALPHMLARGQGHIVLITSMDGKKGIPPDAPYVAAKFALSGFGDVLRQELCGTGVDVSVVFPGRVDTPMIADLEVPWISAKIPPEAVARAVVRAIRRRRAEVIVPFQARLLYAVQCAAPTLADWVVRTFHLEGKPKAR